jgi:hypothetical protein
VDMRSSGAEPGSAAASKLGAGARAIISRRSRISAAPAASLPGS